MVQEWGHSNGETLVQLGIGIDNDEDDHCVDEDEDDNGVDGDDDVNNIDDVDDDDHCDDDNDDDDDIYMCVFPNEISLIQVGEEECSSILVVGSDLSG